MKVGGRGTQGYSRRTHLGAGEHAEQLLKAKPPKSGTWLRGQISVQGLCAQVDRAVILVARGACAMPCEASKPMCERKGWHEVGERPRAAVGCPTWGVDEVGGSTHPVGQR